MPWCWCEEFYSRRYPDDEVLVEDLIDADHETYAHHNCAAYVDVTDNSQAESYCRNCADSLGWDFQKLQGNDILIKKLLTGQWDEKDFLVTTPGTAITSILDNPVQGIQG